MVVSGAKNTTFQNSYTDLCVMKLLVLLILNG